jgi:acid phosphatase
MHFKGSIPPTLLLSTSVLAQTYLSPDQAIVLPKSHSASNPLEWLGGNGPYFKGPDVNGVKNEVPEGCYVDQVAYISRHGSRYPDNGAYNEWVALYTKVCLVFRVRREEWMLMG